MSTFLQQYLPQVFKDGAHTNHPTYWRGSYSRNKSLRYPRGADRPDIGECSGKAEQHSSTSRYFSKSGRLPLRNTHSREVRQGVGKRIYRKQVASSYKRHFLSLRKRRNRIGYVCADNKESDRVEHLGLSFDFYDVAFNEERVDESCFPAATTSVRVVLSV